MRADSERHRLRDRGRWPVPACADRGTHPRPLPRRHQCRAAGSYAVSIWYGRQPAESYDYALGRVDWPVPGSGTYRMFITIASHDERTASVVTYALPIYALRS